jgi:hypothetical protein
MLTGVIKAIEKHSVRYPILVQVTVDKYVAVRIYMFFYCLQRGRLFFLSLSRGLPFKPFRCGQHAPRPTLYARGHIAHHQE